MIDVNDTWPIEARSRGLRVAKLKRYLPRETSNYEVVSSEGSTLARGTVENMFGEVSKQTEGAEQAQQQVECKG
eukprot:6198956-Pleurochrysis_carterae.AAC.1